MSARRRSRGVTVTLAATLAVVVATTSPAGAAPGDLDPTFDGDGRVTTDFPGTRERALAVAVQADGKIVAAGGALGSATQDFTLARYDPDGSLDPSFDGDGKLNTDFAGGSDEAFAVALQPDGKIVAAGHAGGPGILDFGLVRYNPDGSLDPSFGGDGKVTTDFAGDQEGARALTILPDGKLVAAGYAVVPRGSSHPTSPAYDSFDFAVARYNSDGSLDHTFDNDGKATTDIAKSFDIAWAVVVQSDKKIVLAGGADLPTPGRTIGNDFALARYNEDGSLDPTFCGDGRVTTDIAGGFAHAHAVAIQGDGKIVAAGLAYISGNSVFALARYTSCRRSSSSSSIPC
jgi:uncharacterized delta-60 repeat protein